MVYVVPLLRVAIIYEFEPRCVCQDWVSARINPLRTRVLAEFSLTNTATFCIREKTKN